MKTVITIIISLLSICLYGQSKTFTYKGNIYKLDTSIVYSSTNDTLIYKRKLGKPKYCAICRAAPCRNINRSKGITFTSYRK